MVRLAARCKQRQSEREGGGGCERKTDGKKEVQCREYSERATGALRSPSKKEGHLPENKGLPN